MQQALILSTLKMQKEHNWLWKLLESFHYGSLPQFESVCENYPTQISSSALSGHMDCLKKKISIAALVRLAFTRSSAATSSSSPTPTPPSSSPYESGTPQENNMSVHGGLDMHANHIQGAKALSETLQQIHSSPPHHSRAGVSAAWRTISFDVVKQTCKVEEEDVERLVMRAMSQKLLKGSIDQVNRQIFVTWIRPALLLDDHGLTCLQDRLVRWLSAAESLHQQLTSQTTELLGS
ncbi:pci domain-containing protein [Cystoisospora suis]|uniref:Pci domain-containing protein n=1 Tax=Cystoisospora suis TaxID=483139 RepID=A0A2C6KLC0_9APIC|nr:pci domain-containing protein [Cystoisospora suis]